MSTPMLAAYTLAALLIALTPGPGIFYVAARTLAGGRGEGLASSFGTGLGGLVHVAAGALGVSAIVMASADVFTAVKLVGAAYLMWLGVRTYREAGQGGFDAAPPCGVRRAFRDGVVVEACNPKTAAFFLAFVPQFVDPARGDVWLQFAALGSVSVVLNTAVDVVVAFGAARARDGLKARPGLVLRLRQAAGVFICGLGASLAVARRGT